MDNYLNYNLKAMNSAELEELSQKIRHEIIDSVAVNGGHLSPNLGVVELTIALHKIFDLPKDKIIFDVGHQSYTHKILTGRSEAFKTIRQFGSISGFPRSEESEFDAFIAGHAGAALSAAMGIAESNHLLGDKDAHTIAVIGDGAMGCGVTLEALNNIREINGRVIIILNDNKMSISQNVGGIASHLNKIISGNWYLRNKIYVKKMLKKFPKQINLYEFVNRCLTSVKHFILPKGTIFGALGLRYLGPIDGYSFNDLLRVLEFAKNSNESMIIHVVTEKGHGYEYARNFPEKFHGIGAFCKNDGKLKKQNAQNFSKTFGKTIVELANPKLVAITAGMKSGTELSEYAEKNPNNFFDVGISEEHAMTFAAGLAKTGNVKSVIALYSTFLQRAFDGVYHDVCLQNLNVLIAIDRAGIVDDGPTHHGIYDLGFLREMPNLVIMAPKNENEMRFMMHKAMSIKTPVAIRYSKNSSPIEFCPSLPIEDIEIGKAEVVATGTKISLWAMGLEVYRALEIRDRLKAKLNLDIEVVNVRFVAPLDEELLMEKAKTHQIISLEDHVKSGGLATALSLVLASNNAQLSYAFGFDNKVMEHGNIEQIRLKHHLDIDSIVNKIEEDFR